MIIAVDFVVLLLVPMSLIGLCATAPRRYSDKTGKPYTIKNTIADWSTLFIWIGWIPFVYNLHAIFVSVDLQRISGLWLIIWLIVEVRLKSHFTLFGQSFRKC